MVQRTASGGDASECLNKSEALLDYDKNKSSKEEASFEKLLDHIGSRGKFQKRFNAVFNVISPCLDALNVYAIILAVQTPDHWCHVPGRERTNYTLEEWKNLTIPRDGDSFSQCTMYARDENQSVSSPEIVPCRYSWEYDDTYFSLTIPSQQNWVCEDKILLTNAMFIAQALSVVLCLVFGYLGDKFGRKPQYFLTTAFLALGRTAIVFTPPVYPLFILAQMVAAGASGIFLEVSIAVGLELTDVDHRSNINFIAMMSMSLGTFIAAGSAWVLRNWIYFSLTYSCALLILFFFYRWFPESPRWLVARGRYKDAHSVLRKIAEVNGKQVPPDVLDVLHSMSRRRSLNVGFMSIFSSWNLFKNTVLLILARATSMLSRYCLMMNVGNLSVNPFVAMLAQSLCQGPGFFVGLHCVNRFGRRWMGVAAPLLVAVTAGIVIAMISASMPWVVVTCANVLMQLFVTIFMGVSNLQSMEVHPTRLRQIASALEWTFTGLAISAGPYIVILGGSIDRRLPFSILLALNLVVAVLVSFLPESSHQQLPETLEDAAKFGHEHRYWSWKGRRQVSTAKERSPAYPEATLYSGPQDYYAREY